MSPMLLKNTLRDIKNTKARFFSIMLIIMIGVGFFTGIKSSSPSMMEVVDRYYKDNALMDYRIISKVGFDDEDIKTLGETNGVSKAQGAYFYDVFLGEESGGSVVRLHTYPENEDSLNKVNITAGRAPEKGDEIVVGGSSMGSFAIGEKVRFSLADSDITDVLKYNEYTIVGQVDSPLYISFERGTTNIGNGSISAYMLIKSESFCLDRYTEAFVKTDISSEYKPYTEEYDKAIKDKTPELEAVGEKRIEVFEEENIVSAQSSLDEAKIEFEKEKEKVYAELDEGKEKLEKAKADYKQGIKDGKEELDAALLEITEGRVQLEKGKQELEQKIKEGKEEIEKAQAELDAGKVQTENGKQELRSAYIEAMTELGETESSVLLRLEGKDMPDEEDLNYLKEISQEKAGLLNTVLRILSSRKDALEKAAEESGADLSSNEEYNILLNELNTYTQMKVKLDYLISDGLSQMKASAQLLEASSAQLETAQKELDAAKALLEKEKLKGEKALKDAEAELRNGELQYEQGVKDLEKAKKDGKAELEKAEKEYTEGYEKAVSEFAKAEKELLDAQKEIDDYKDIEWYVFDRSDNPGYTSYQDNAGKVDAVATVFPIFFLLVAVLVCVTTMTRLIEEKRGDIGALITLGYRKRDIVLKFLIYSMSASMLGCVLGVAVGVLSLPAVIFNAYGMIYSLPDLILRIDWFTAVLGAVVAIVSTSAVTVIACLALLRVAPANLLRPKAPKPGKRILLERISFLWSRLSFTAKVTARNIFRYKARFLMTVLGVAGCTALILTSFGLHNSIGDIVSLQFEELSSYDAVIVPADGEGDTSALLGELDSDIRIENSLLCRQISIEAEKGNKKVSSDVSLFVPEDTDSFEKIITLRERVGHKAISLDDSGVVLSEKLAKTLGVSEGGTILVKEGDTQSELKVSGVCENYVMGYVYITPELYEESFRKPFEGNMVFAQIADNTQSTESELGTDYLEKDCVLGISFMSDSINNFRDMIQSLNLVIIAVLVCAAGLAFVVLYNLTNINIAERKREISTLKVLGFKNGETSAYIYRENILLTVLGMALGLVLGVFLLNFVIVTIEVDMVMFGRLIHTVSYFLAGLMTLVFAAAVNVVMHFKIKKIDMIESLKSVD